MRTNNLPDNELVSLILQGDTSAFNVIAERYSNTIFTSFVYMKIEYDLAQDLTQDCLVKAMENIQNGKYRSESKMRGWLGRIAFNAAMDHFRSNKRAAEGSKYKYYTNPGFEDNGNFEFKESDYPNPLEAMLAETHRKTLRSKGYRDLSEMLDQILEELPREQKEILILRYYLNNSFKEIALITKAPINTCLGRMRYALINIRKMLDSKPQIIRQTLLTELVTS